MTDVNTSVGGHVTRPHVAPGAGPRVQSVDAVGAVEGRGRFGERYFDRAGSWSGERGRPLLQEDRTLTLVEAEPLEIV